MENTSQLSSSQTSWAAWVASHSQRRASGATPRRCARRSGRGAPMGHLPHTHRSSTTPGRPAGDRSAGRSMEVPRGPPWRLRGRRHPRPDVRPAAPPPTHRGRCRERQLRPALPFAGRLTAGEAARRGHGWRRTLSAPGEPPPGRASARRAARTRCPPEASVPRSTSRIGAGPWRWRGPGPGAGPGRRSVRWHVREMPPAPPDHPGPAPDPRTFPVRGRPLHQVRWPRAPGARPVGRDRASDRSPRPERGGRLASRSPPQPGQWRIAPTGAGTGLERPARSGPPAPPAPRLRSRPRAAARLVSAGSDPRRVRGQLPAGTGGSAWEVPPSAARNPAPAESPTARRARDRTRN